MKPVLPVSLRTFLLVFLPMSMALVAGFLHLQRGTETEVNNGLRRTLAEVQRAHLSEWEQFRVRHRRMLLSVADNAKLVSALSQWNASGFSPGVRQAIEEQLNSINNTLGYELLAVRDASGRPVSGVAYEGTAKRTLGLDKVAGLADGLIRVDGLLYETLVVPVNSSGQNLGVLVVGQRFNLKKTFGPAALLYGTKVLETSIAGVFRADVERALAGCSSADNECALHLNGENFLVMRPSRRLFGDGYSVCTFHSVDAASAAIVASARQSFRVSLLATLLAAMLVGLWATRSLIRPLTQFVDLLKKSEEQGLLRSNFPTNSTTKEINELARAFNHAALAIAESQSKLDEAYIKFTRTMAQTLDARDPYTAGHSSRVSAYALAIGRSMNLSPEELEVIRVGANLHDIGKIGIPDDVLRKPGRLTPEELETIKQHPVIGRRILEGVERFHSYLEIVELHHENHDGSGYPWGLHGELIPLGARVVHVVDAFDAMTTNRPYRKAMEVSEAKGILRAHSGTMFDPRVVEVFLELLDSNTFTTPEGEIVKDLSALNRELAELSRP